MRIGCLQFSPLVGDVNNNLSRADAVLLKANIEDLDLLVLPEMAFTGYNFSSLRQISPFLEPSGSGISSLWARTIALKHNCHVVVGYPEKVDCTEQWPSSPEYYNSTIVINPDGETVADYRKCHLFAIDETWALESTQGFFREHIPGLGQTSIGICMDIKFTSPWDAFEFGYHILHSESNLVIVSMAWVTNKDRARYSSLPYDPDLEALAYWTTRLEPVIRAEDNDEIIVVFCNRCGSEGEAVYAGTSAVLGIKGGEVSVYGLLGRGERELLVIDTDQHAFAKMVLRSIPSEEPVPTPPEPRQPRSATEPNAIGETVVLPLPTPPPPGRPLPSEDKGKGKGTMMEEPVSTSTSPVAPQDSRSRPVGRDKATQTAHGFSPTKPRPSSLPRLHIPPDNQPWQKDDAARYQYSNSAGTQAEKSGQSADVHFSSWLHSQAKVAAAHPRQNKRNPDSASPSSSYLGKSGRSSTRRTTNDGASNRSSRSSSPPKSTASGRHRRPTSRSNSDRLASLSRVTRSTGPPVNEDRRLARFKDSPKTEKPNQYIMDQFLQALAEARLGSEPRPVFFTTAQEGVDRPESIPIAASPGVLQSAFTTTALTLRAGLDTLPEDPVGGPSPPLYQRRVSHHEGTIKPRVRATPSISSV